MKIFVRQNTVLPLVACALMALPPGLHAAEEKSDIAAERAVGRFDHEH